MKLINDPALKTETVIYVSEHSVYGTMHLSATFSIRKLDVPTGESECVWPYQLTDDGEALTDLALDCFVSDFDGRIVNPGKIESRAYTPDVSKMKRLISTGAKLDKAIQKARNARTEWLDTFASDVDTVARLLKARVIYRYFERRGGAENFDCDGSLLAHLTEKSDAFAARYGRVRSHG